jgi:hypothetical protein
MHLNTRRIERSNQIFSFLIINIIGLFDCDLNYDLRNDGLSPAGAVIELETRLTSMIYLTAIDNLNVRKINSIYTSSLTNLL